MVAVSFYPSVWLAFEMSAELSGPFVVLVTPLDEHCEQDNDSLGRLVDYYLKSGIAGLTVLGESSEVDRLSQKERADNVRIVFERCKGKVPVVVGASHDSVQLAKDACLAAQDEGAAAVMLAPPKNQKLRDDKIFEFYSNIGDSIDIPIILQDYPDTGRPYLSPQLISRIASEVSAVKYLKLEDPPTPMKLSKVLEATKGRVKVFGALGGKGYFWELDRGAVGVMTASPTPEYLVGIWKSYLEGNRDMARDLFFCTLPLAHSYSELGLSLRKEVLVRRGVISTSKMKPPAAELDEKARREVAELLEWTEVTSKSISGIEPLRSR